MNPHNTSLDPETIGRRQDSVEPSDQAFALTRICASHCYIFGLIGAMRVLLSILGPPFTGRTYSIGLDQQVVRFHACQSIICSLATLLLLLPLCLFDGSSAALNMVAALIVITKVALFNLWFPRTALHPRSDPTAARLPFISTFADRLANLLLPRDSAAKLNTVYFGGRRPFVGLGPELNAWTVSVDLTKPRKGSLVDTSGDGQDQSEPKIPSSIERDLIHSVHRKVGETSSEEVRLGEMLFVDGDMDPECRTDFARRYRRPHSNLDLAQRTRLDKEETTGRRYHLLFFSKPKSDIVLSHLIRFTRSGKFLFCEMAAHLLPSGRRGLYTQDRLLRAHPLLLALFGLVLLIGASTLAGALTYSTALLLPVDSSLPLPDSAGQLLLIVLGWSIPLATGSLMVIILLFRAVRVAFRATRIYLDLGPNLGGAVTYRETCSHGGSPRYFDTQTVIRGLRTQEKIIIQSIADYLEELGVDASDFQENVVSFTNQGIINTGHIRGSVGTRVTNLSLRRSKYKRGLKGK